MPLGPVGGRIRLGFDFTLQSTNEEVHAEQNATIQSLEEVPNGNKNASSALFQHGVQFDNVAPRMALLVYELQQEIRRSWGEVKRAWLQPRASAAESRALPVARP